MQARRAPRRNDNNGTGAWNEKGSRSGRVCMRRYASARTTYTDGRLTSVEPRRAALVGEKRRDEMERGRGREEGAARDI